jgi:hypothetical protein
VNKSGKIRQNHGRFSGKYLQLVKKQEVIKDGNRDHGRTEQRRAAGPRCCQIATGQ